MAITSNSVADILTSTGTSTVYTVPASTETTVVSIILSNASGVAASVQVYIDKAGGGTNVRLFYDASMADDAVSYIDSKIVMETTDILKVATDQQPFHYAVSMYEKT